MRNSRRLRIIKQEKKSTRDAAVQYERREYSSNNLFDWPGTRSLDEMEKPIEMEMKSSSNEMEKTNETETKLTTTASAPLLRPIMSNHQNLKTKHSKTVVFGNMTRNYEARELISPTEDALFEVHRTSIRELESVLELGVRARGIETSTYANQPFSECQGRDAVFSAPFLFTLGHELVPLHRLRIQVDLSFEKAVLNLSLRVAFPVGSRENGKSISNHTDRGDDSSKSEHRSVRPSQLGYFDDDDDADVEELGQELSMNVNAAVLMPAQSENLIANETFSKMKIEAFASFHDSPPDKVVDGAKWEAWLLPAFSEHLEHHRFKPTAINSVFLRLFFQDTNFEPFVVHKILTAAFEALPHVDYVLHVFQKAPPNSFYAESALPGLVELIPNCVWKDDDPLTDLSNRPYNETTTTQLLSLDSDSVVSIVDAREARVFVAARPNFRPALKIVDAADASSLDLEGVVSEAAADELKSLYGRCYLQELINSDEIARTTCLTAVDPITRESVGLIGLAKLEEVDTLVANFRVEHLNFLLRQSAEEESDANLGTLKEALGFSRDDEGKMPSFWNINTREPKSSRDSATTLQSRISLEDDAYPNNIMLVVRRRVAPKRKNSVMTIHEGTILDKNVKISKKIFDDLMNQDSSKSKHKKPVVVTTDQFFDFVAYANPSDLVGQVNGRDDDDDSKLELIEEDSRHSICSSFYPHLGEFTANDNERGSMLNCPKIEPTKNKDFLNVNKNAEEREEKEEEEKEAASADQSADADADAAAPPISESNVVVAFTYFIRQDFVSRSRDFLPHIFLKFPRLDFLAVTMPRCALPVHSLDEFMRVTSTPKSNLPQELHLFNRAGLRGADFSVKHLTSEKELKGVASLAWRVAGGSNAKNVLIDFKYAFDYGTTAPLSMKTTFDVHSKRTNILAAANQSNSFAFVAVVNDEVVGYALVADQLNIESLRAIYRVESYVNLKMYSAEEHGHIHHFVLSPIYTNLEKSFLGEIMRLTRKSSLFYPVHPLYALNMRYSLITCFQHFVPIRPRHALVYPEGPNSPAKNLTYLTQHPFALFHINKRLLHRDRVPVTLRIVVVGASTTGLSFLAKLSFLENFLFTNLILVSFEGVPGESFPDPNIQNFLEITNQWRDVGLVSFRGFVKVVRGRVTRIDRVKRRLHLKEDGAVDYDVLILTPGRMYQAPMPLGIASVDKFGTEILEEDDEVFRSTSSTPFDLTERLNRNYPIAHAPDNVFVINGAPCAVKMIEEMEAASRKIPASKIVVYGSGVEVHACVANLVKIFRAARIVLVVAERQKEAEMELQTDEETRILRRLEGYTAKRGVDVRRGVLMEWRWSLRKREVEACRFASLFNPKESFTIDKVGFVISYATKQTDYDIFYAINNCGTLVYDGGITINNRFETPDPCIKAAGPATVYKRRYYAEKEVQSRYSSSEVGERLAKVLVSDLALKRSWWGHTSVKWSQTLGLLPKFRRPLVSQCQLLNGIGYLHVRSPNMRHKDQTLIEALKESYEFDKNKHKKKFFQTGSLAHLDDGATKGYFYLGCDLYGRVCEILCLTRDPAALQLLPNLRRLHGVSVYILNNLEQQYAQEAVDDLFDFFSEDWIYAVLIDRFQREQLKDLQKGSAVNRTVRELAKEGYNHDKALRMAESIVPQYLILEDAKTRCGKLVDYLQENCAQLSQYASPSTLTCREAPHPGIPQFMPPMRNKCKDHEASKNISKHKWGEDDYDEDDEDDDDYDDAYNDDVGY